MTDGSLAHRGPSSPPTEPGVKSVVYSASHPAATVWFSGLSDAPPSDVALGGIPRERAWLRQIHSARVIAARPGLSGEGDALWTREEGLALFVATADCVPVLVASSSSVAAIHAGWRGISEGVVAAALERLGPSAGPVTAWIGPAIGPCCYEVEDHVAIRVAAASSSDVVIAHDRRRPHLDLSRAVHEQLRRVSVSDIRLLRHCTRCHASLASFRREGRGSGRNYSVIWRRRGAPEGGRPNARS